MNPGYQTVQTHEKTVTSASSQSAIQHWVLFEWGKKEEKKDPAPSLGRENHGKPQALFSPLKIASSNPARGGPPSLRRSIWQSGGAVRDRAPASPSSGRAAPTWGTNNERD